MLYDHLAPHAPSTLSGLPSGESAQRFARGDWGALPEVAFHTVLRATLIGAAMSLAGMPSKDVVKFALAGALGIEAFVLVWAALNKDNEEDKS